MIRRKLCKINHKIAWFTLWNVHYFLGCFYFNILFDNWINLKIFSQRFKILFNQKFTHFYQINFLINFYIYLVHFVNILVNFISLLIIYLFYILLETLSKFLLIIFLLIFLNNFFNSWLLFINFYRLLLLLLLLNLVILLEKWIISNCLTLYWIYIFLKILWNLDQFLKIQKLH